MYLSKYLWNTSTHFISLEVATLIKFDSVYSWLLMCAFFLRSNLSSLLLSFPHFSSPLLSFFLLFSSLHFSSSSLPRRNLPGDRQKALDIMLPLVESEEQVASDIYCMVGRIYKDMFLDSHFTDSESRDRGTQWWGAGTLFSLWRLHFFLSSYHL